MISYDQLGLAGTSGLWYNKKLPTSNQPAAHLSTYGGLSFKQNDADGYIAHGSSNPRAIANRMH